MRRPPTRGRRSPPGPVGCAIVAWIELAKLREHRLRDRPGALGGDGRGLGPVERGAGSGCPEPALEADLVGRRRRLGCGGASRAEARRRRVDPASPARASPTWLAALGTIARRTRSRVASDHDRGPVRDAVEADRLDGQRSGRGREAEVGGRRVRRRPQRSAGRTRRGEERRQERVAGAGRVDLASVAGRQVAHDLVPARPSARRVTSSPPSLPSVTSRSRAGLAASGRGRRGSSPASTSSRLTPTRSARASRALGAGARRRDLLARRQVAQEPLPAEATMRRRGIDRRPGVADLAGDRHERPRPGVAPRLGQRHGRQRRARREHGLDPARRASRRCGRPALVEVDEQEVDAGGAQHVELAGAARGVVHADDRRRPQPEPGRRQGGVGHATAEPPAARVVRGDVAAGRADVDDLDGAVGHASILRGLGSYTPGPADTHDGAAVFFYELHEGDDEVFSDVLVVERIRMGARGVLRARPDDPPPGPGPATTTIPSIEAIAIELERDHGFIFVSDDSLVAAVNVSTRGSDNFLAELEVDLADATRTTTMMTTRTRTASRRATSRRSTPTSTRTRTRLQLTSARPSRSSRSAAEQDLDDVAVADPVGLALGAQPAGLARLGHRAQRDQVLVATRSRRG